MTRAYLGLGSNLGDRHALLRQAAEALDWGDVSVVARSRVYETTPVGGPDAQPDFLNQVIAVETALDARGLWERCSAVEASLGRSREHETRCARRRLVGRPPYALDADRLEHVVGTRDGSRAHTDQSVRSA